MSKLSLVTLVASSLIFNAGLYAEDFHIPEKITLSAYYNNEEISAVKQVNGGKTTYSFTGNNGFKAISTKSANINALQLVLGATAKAESDFPKMKNDSKWHKIVSHYRSGTCDDNTVTTLSTEDTVINYITSVKDPKFAAMKKLRTKNTELIKEITGSSSVIGMNRTDAGNLFGYMEEYSYCIDYQFKLLDSAGEYPVLTLYFEDNKVKEIEIRRIPENKLKLNYYLDGEGDYYCQLPEHWYTKGQMTGTGVNIRQEPKTGAVIGNTGWKHPYVYFAETRDTGEDFKWLKIRVKVIDENTKEYKGIEGWVYGRYVAPSDKTYSLSDSVYASISAVEEMPYFLGINNAKRSTIKESGQDEKGQPTTYEQAVLTWSEGLSCIYGESNPENITSKPKGDYEQLPFKWTITSDKIPFLGLKVGMGIDELKNFNEKLIKAGWGSSNDANFQNTETAFWNFDMRQITVTIKDNKVESISAESLPAY